MLNASKQGLENLNMCLLNSQLTMHVFIVDLFEKFQKDMIYYNHFKQILAKCSHMSWLGAGRSYLNYTALLMMVSLATSLLIMKY